MIFKILLLFVATIVAFWISAICGGGASLVLIPILSLLLTSTAIPVALTIGTFTSSASRIYFFKKHISWKIFFLFVPFSIPAVIVGAYLIKYANPIYLQFVIAIFLISNVRELIKPKKKLLEDQKPYPKYVLALVGFVAGFVSGLTGAVGLLFNRFYLRYGLSKEEIIATRAANEIFLHTVKLVLYFSLGLATTNSIYLGLTIAAASVVSSFSIKYILPYLSETVFRKIGYSAMFISGVFMLYNTGNSIITNDRLSLNSKIISDGYETQLAWRETATSLEFTYDEGFEIEISIPLEELPLPIHEKYKTRFEKSDKYFLEKVFSFEGTAYEIHLVENGKIIKIEEEG